MKLINQSVEIWEQPEGEVGIYKQIERAARLCYKSEDKTTEDSYKRFIDMLNINGHQSPLEHGTVYLKYRVTIPDDLLVKSYSNNPHSQVRIVDDIETGNKYAYITTNFRVIKEHQWEEDLKYLCEPTKYHEKRISVHIITSIGISRELNRHRCHSICEESTRYCNYSKDKFDNELTFIIPNWVNTHCPNKESAGPSINDITWSSFMEVAEHNYMFLLKHGWKPQQARDVLPLATKTELIHTAFESDWEEFFKLRCSSVAHPMMQELANQIKELVHKDKL